jgi:hypothetical protein
MRLAYRPLVQRDVSGIVRHYDGISSSLGDEFWAELTRLLEVISANPERFHFSVRELRRAKMRRFPYHLLFRIPRAEAHLATRRGDFASSLPKESMVGQVCGLR